MLGVGAEGGSSHFVRDRLRDLLRLADHLTALFTSQVPVLDDYLAVDVHIVYTCGRIEKGGGIGIVWFADGRVRGGRKARWRGRLTRIL